MGAVYLELQNISGVVNPMEIYYDLDHALHPKLLDESNQPVARPTITDSSIFSPPNYWIMLPIDSTLRFRISVNGYGIPKDGGLFIGLMSADWLIPPTVQTDYFLSISFTVLPPKDPGHIHAWKGELKFPKLKLPR